MSKVMIPNESQPAETNSASAVPMWLWALIGAAIVDGEAGAVLFEDIAISGPAETAGILPGDQLTAIDGALVESAAAARRTIRAYGAGAYVTFSIERGDRLEQVGMYLGYVYPIVGEPPIPVEPPIVMTVVPPIQPPDTQGEGRLGIYYRTLQRGDPFAVSNGALIISLWEGGAAQAAGLEPSDIITGVGGRDLSTAFTLSDALSRYASGQTIRLDVWDHRTGTIVQVRVRLDG